MISQEAERSIKGGLDETNPKGGRLEEGGRRVIGGGEQQENDE